MKSRISENRKVTLSIGQLRRLVKESVVSEDDIDFLDNMRAHDSMEIDKEVGKEYFEKNGIDPASLVKWGIYQSYTSNDDYTHSGELMCHYNCDTRSEAISCLKREMKDKQKRHNVVPLSNDSFMVYQTSRYNGTITMGVWFVAPSFCHTKSIKLDK